MAHRLQKLKKKQISNEQQGYQQPPNVPSQQSNFNINTQPQQNMYHPVQSPSNQSQIQNNMMNFPNHNFKARNIPRPIHPSLSQISNHDKHAFKKGNMAFPPVDTLFSSQNTYDASPYFIRPTSAVMQAGSRRFQFPLGAWIQPFGSPLVHNVKLTAPLRCQRCKAYINPYFKFDPSNKSAVCNICGIKFLVPQTVDKQIFSRNEISTEGVIDFEVSDKFYMKKKTNIIKVIIAIQMSLPMIELGVFGSVIQSVRSALQGMDFQNNVRVGIIYYNDDGVTFIKPKIKKIANQQQNQQGDFIPIQFKVNTKAGSFCCPLSDKQFLFNPSDPQQSEKLLKIIDYVNAKSEQYYKKGKFVHLANYISTIKCIQQCFDNQTGRVMLFSFFDPRQAPCALRPRNEQQSKNPLKPMNLDYYDVAKQLLGCRIGVDHYIFGKDALIQHQLSTTHFISSLTGGNIYLYCPYNPQTNGQHLYYTIYKNLTKQYVYDVDFTCRVSNGLTVGQFLMADGAKQVRDIGLSMMDPSHSFGITFQHEEKIEDSNGAYIQFAMMYTTGNGQRKIRLINYRYALNDKIQSIHSAADYLAFSNILARKYVSKLRKGDPIKVRQQFITKLINILVQYKQEGFNSGKFNQLAVHPNLSPSLVYLHSIFNSKLFLNSIKLPADYKNSQMLKISTLGFSQFALRYYPHLYSINTDIYDVQQGSPMPGDFMQDNQQIAILPPNLPLVKSSMQSKGVYMYNTGDYIIIIVMQSADREVMIDLFGTQDWAQIQSQGLTQLETSHNIRVNNMISELRRRSSQNNGIYQPLIIKTPIKKGPFNDFVMSVLKQETMEQSYFTFLDNIHRAIQLKGK